MNMIENHIPFKIEEEDDITIINNFNNNDNLKNNISIEKNNISIEKNNNDFIEININDSNETLLKLSNNNSNKIKKKYNFKLYFNNFLHKLNKLYTSYPYYVCLKDSPEKEYACVLIFYFGSMFTILNYIL